MKAKRPLALLLALLIGLLVPAVVLMACCNQSFSAIALSALGEAFSPGHARASTFGFMPLTINGKTSAPREAR